jgi:hypothetical protein
MSIINTDITFGYDWRQAQLVKPMSVDLEYDGEMLANLNIHDAIMHLHGMGMNQGGPSWMTLLGPLLSKNEALDDPGVDLG